MMKTQLLKMRVSGRNKLQRFHEEARKTFNLLGLVIAHPLNIERRTALKFQRERERAALSEYEECRDVLFTHVDAE